VNRTTISPPSPDAIAGKWKQQIGAAKLAWGQLTHDELMKLDGQATKLTGLIQERYAVTRDEAEKQVKTFLKNHEFCTCCQH